MWRRLRGRFGIYAPRVAVRAQLPWYWRAALTAILGLLVLSLAGWIYELRSQRSGFESGEIGRQLGELRERVAQRDQELARLRASSTEIESQFQIERTAQQRLSSQIKTLEVENARLREDLAVFEHLVSVDTANADETIVRRLKVEPDSAPGSYRYRMLLAVPGRGKEFHGRLQIAVTMSRGGKTAMLSLPRDSSDAQKYLLGFRNFHRVEGSFDVPGDAVVSQVEVRLLQGERVVATQRVRL